MFLCDRWQVDQQLKAQEMSVDQQARLHKVVQATHSSAWDLPKT